MTSSSFTFLMLQMMEQVLLNEKNSVLESAGLIILLSMAFLWQKRNKLCDVAFKYQKGS